MSRKPKKGYYVKGHFVAEGSELDLELQAERTGGEPSRTELKKESADLQKLGEALLTLRADLKERLDLPETLLTALEALRRITNFEGRRRQSQYVGKLMRQLDEPTRQAVRNAIDEQHNGSARRSLALHPPRSGATTWSPLTTPCSSGCRCTRAPTRSSCAR